MTRRLQRLWRYWRPGFTGAGKTYPRSLPWRLLETVFLLADCLFLPELLVFGNRIFKPGTRRLTNREIELARLVFNESIDYQKVWIDDRARLGCRQYRFAYVGFNCINCWGKLADPHFIHEMVHVWQYQREGSVYIPRALYAQRTVEGYNYGGVEKLINARWQDFNYEQQGDIVADYFCLLQGLKPRHCAPDPAYLPVFRAVLKTYLPWRHRATE